MLVRLFDIFFALFGLLVGLPALIIIAIFGYFDTGSPIFCQVRVGRYKKPFILVKFRTMRKDTISVASHLANRNAITFFGRFLRKTKLDELPQLWNVLNQEELTYAREKRGVYTARPGITGLAQVNNIDMSTPDILAKADAEMLNNFTLTDYFKYIFLTVVGKGYGDRIR